MTITHHIEVRQLIEMGEVQPAVSDFASRFAANRVGLSDAFRFDDENRFQESVSFLQQHRIQWQHFYDFSLDREEVRDYPAFYFGPPVMFHLIVDDHVNAKEMKNNDVALDLPSKRIVITSRAQAIFETVASGLSWQRIYSRNQRSYFELEILNSLPEPIRIPHPVEVSERSNPPDTYAIRSDGRDVISDANVNTLAKFGIARCEKVELPNNRVLSSPRRLVSGRLLDRLWTGKVKGLLLPPVPLLLASHPAVST